MSAPNEQLARAVAQTGRVVHAITPDQLDAPTPCTEWAVRALLAHTIDVLNQVTGTVTGAPVDPVDAAGDLASLVAAFDRAAAASAEAWHEPGVMERELMSPWGPTPGARVCRLNLADTVVHCWDLAQATGQPTDGFDADLATGALAFMLEMMKPEYRGGPAFGPEVEVAPDAPAYDRLVAFAGREP
jgi:uncharacterized protein (TIGR03086 family)